MAKFWVCPQSDATPPLSSCALSSRTLSEKICFCSSECETTEWIRKHYSSTFNVGFISIVTKRANACSAIKTIRGLLTSFHEQLNYQWLVEHDTRWRRSYLLQHLPIVLKKLIQSPVVHSPVSFLAWRISTAWKIPTPFHIAESTLIFHSSN